MSKERRHTAIMFTDIVGYTTLMGSDEDRAFEVLAKNREIHTKLIDQFNGSLIKEMGDGMLISFDLASEAVRCAIEIQKACNSHDIPLKIGIHEGEMVFEGHDVLGDGVNIASRLESETQPGCILISGSVYHDIRNKADIQARFIEEKQFKNVSEEIKVYQVLCGDEANDNSDHKTQITSSKNKKPIIAIISFFAIVIVAVLVWQFGKWNKTSSSQKLFEIRGNSIAVLPFRDDSEGSNNQYFCDGMMGDILNHLQKIRDLNVKSREAVEPYRNRTQSLSTIAHELNVGYLLEGSVRKYGENFRVSVTLVDPKSGNQLWTESYDGVFTDTIFVIQSHFAKNIATSLNAVITPEEESRIDKIPTTQTAAYDLLVQGRYENGKYYNEQNRSHLKEAHRLINKALEVDPNYASAYAFKASVFFAEGYSDSMFIYAKKAIEIDPDNALAHERIGRYYERIEGNSDKALQYALKAHELNPNNVKVHYTLATIYCRQKHNFKKGFYYLNKVYEIENDYTRFYSNIGFTFLSTGGYDKAEIYYKKSMEINARCGDLNKYNRALVTQGKYAEALHFTDSICPLLDCNKTCNEWFIWIYTFQKEFAKAEQYIKKLEDAGGEKISNPTIGYVLYQLGRIKEAEDIFIAYLQVYKSKIDHSPGQTYFRLAQIHAFTNNKKKALQYMDELVEKKLAIYYIDLMTRDPMFQNLWDDPDFKAIIKKVQDEKAVIRTQIREMEENGELGF